MTETLEPGAIGRSAESNSNSAPSTVAAKPSRKSKDSPPEATSPDLFSFLNYREFLGQWFRFRKALQPAYSGAVFAKRAGLGSHTLLGMVIRGDRNLSSKSIRSFVRALDLKGREAMYFEKLVLFNQSKNSEDRTYYFEQLSAINGPNQRKIVTDLKNYAAYLSHWYIVAIRELVSLESFRADPEWISAKLKRRISRREAQEAWELLLSMGMVAQDGTGGYRIVSPTLDIDPGSIDFAIRNYHREYLERAREAIDGDPHDEREFSSLTLPLCEADYPVLKERIKEFRKKLLVDFPSSKTGRSRVVAVNLQALVLTDSGRTTPKNKEKLK